LAYFEKVEPFFACEWRKRGGAFAAVYGASGEELRPPESLAPSAGALSVFAVTDKKLARDMYDKIFGETLVVENDEGYWDNRYNYYDQNWIWLGLGLYGNHLPNLWHSADTGNAEAGAQRD
jgi:hypothetical protein